MKQVTERRRHGLAVFLFVFLGMAPTVGDIGSCGQTADELDAPTFFDFKARIDCRRCHECDLVGTSCDTACNELPLTSFSTGCRPLVHDGEVCLRVLLHASCDDYGSYMNDSAPTAPSECQFCPLR